MKQVNRKPVFLRNMKTRKFQYAGHILRGSGGKTSILILEGYIEGVRNRGRPRFNCFDNVERWTQEKQYGKIKRMAEDRDGWRAKTVNHQIAEEDTH